MKICTGCKINQFILCATKITAQAVVVTISTKSCIGHAGESDLGISKQHIIRLEFIGSKAY